MNDAERKRERDKVALIFTRGPYSTWQQAGVATKRPAIGLIRHANRASHKFFSFFRFIYDPNLIFENRQIL